MHYLEEPCADYVVTAVETTVELHREGIPGDILIFLTGELQAIARLAAQLRFELDLSSTGVAGMEPCHGLHFDEVMHKQRLS